MKKVLIVLFLVVVGFFGAFYSLNNYIYEQKQAYAGKTYRDAEYIIDGSRVRLTDGRSEIEAAPGSASKIITLYFGNELITDLNSDGREDVVFLLTQETGGSGRFFYVVAALNTERGYVGSEAVLLGDRIAPQTINKGNGKIVVVNYADRALGEPFTVSPSVGKSIWLLLDPQSMQFGEVAQDFEGEANPAQMSLNMKTWNWISAMYNDGREIKPLKPAKFTLTFGKEGKFNATTDCNSMAGSFMANEDGEITFTQIISTKMFCEGSQESDFASLLETTSGYHFTSKGELILDLKFDSGSVVFN